jgi:hypothetical protein
MQKWRFKEFLGRAAYRGIRNSSPIRADVFWNLTPSCKEDNY